MILEVGLNKKYAMISQAVNAARDGDEILIYSGWYDDILFCDKELTFTGLPSNKNDYATYPVVCNPAESFSCFWSKCKAYNLVFTATDSLNPKDLNLLMAKEKDSFEEDEALEKMCLKYRECKKESYTFALRAGSLFENCIFFGASKSGVAVMTDPLTERCTFSKCGFFFNGETVSENYGYTDGGSAISCLYPEVAQIVMIDECLFKYNEKGIESRGQACFIARKSFITCCQSSPLVAGDDSLIIIEESEIVNNSKDISFYDNAEVIATACRLRGRRI